MQQIGKWIEVHPGRGRRRTTLYRRASSRSRGLKHLGLLDAAGRVATLTGGDHQLDRGVIETGEVARGKAGAEDPIWQGMALAIP